MPTDTPLERLEVWAPAPGRQAARERGPIDQDVTRCEQNRSIPTCSLLSDHFAAATADCGSGAEGP